VPPPKRDGLDPRLLYGVAAAMLVVTGVAFGAGMLLSERTRAASSAPAASAAPPSPAKMAARILVDALGHVADGCDIEVDGPATKDILAFVQRECGPASGHTKAAKTLRDGDAADRSYRTKKRPDPDAADTDAPVRPPPRRPARSGCITSCAREHSSCVSSCGPEPGDANQYDAWQSCSSKCLAAESRCRLGCR
jgi:hypothetical protein